MGSTLRSATALLLFDHCVGEAINVLDLESCREKIGEGLRQAVTGCEGRGAGAALRISKRYRGVEPSQYDHSRRRGGRRCGLRRLPTHQGQADRQRYEQRQNSEKTSWIFHGFVSSLRCWCVRSLKDTAAPQVPRIC